jgi:hypothetical protein
MRATTEIVMIHDRILRTGSFFVAVWCMACGGGEPNAPVPEPGRLQVVLQTPNADDGAVLIRLEGEGITAVHPAPGIELWVASGTSSSRHLVARGNITNGVIAEIDVGDRNRSDSYAGTVEQVAARTTYRQQPAGGYAVRVVRP